MTATHPVHGPVRQVAPVLAGSGGPDVATLPDWSRTDTDEILLAAGWDRTRIAELRDLGVVA